MSDGEALVIQSIEQALSASARAVQNNAQSMCGNIPLTIFHYTTSAGLRGILASRRIWATHYRFLNDASEIDYGMFVLGSVVDRLKAENDDPVVQTFLGLLVANGNLMQRYFDCYIACFCSHDDLLNQWRHYAGNDGYALGFSTVDIARPTTWDCPERSFFLRKVNYNVQQQNEILTELLEGAVSVLKTYEESMDSATVIIKICDILRFTLLNYICTFKHPAFEAEQEWRIVHLAIPDECDYILFRDGQFGLTPYIELELKNEVGDRLPLVRITHSPTSNAENVRFALNSLVRAKGYDEVQITGSVLPVRV